MINQNIFEDIISTEEFKNIKFKNSERLKNFNKELIDKEIYIYKYSNEEFVIYFKTKIGYKGNFKAILYHTLSNISDFIFNSKNKQYISIKESGVFEELYIKKYLTNNMIEVYFDLN